MITNMTISSLLYLTLRRPISKNHSAHSQDINHRPFRRIENFIKRERKHFKGQFRRQRPMFNFIRCPSLLRNNRRLITFNFRPYPIASKVSRNKQIKRSNRYNTFNPQRINDTSPRVAPNHHLSTCRVPSRQNIQNVRIRSLVFTTSYFRRGNMTNFSRFFVRNAITITPHSPYRLRNSHTPPTSSLTPTRISPRNSSSNGQICSQVPRRAFIFMNRRTNRRLTKGAIYQERAPLPIQYSPYPWRLPIKEVRRNKTNLQGRYPKNNRVRSHSCRRLCRGRIRSGRSPFNFAPLD